MIYHLSLRLYAKNMNYQYEIDRDYILNILMPNILF